MLCLPVDRGGREERIIERDHVSRHLKMKFTERESGIGFAEFVPHVWWRLQGKPYFAVVVTRKNFDGLAWIINPKTPQRLDGIALDSSVLKPTRLSPLRYDADG